MLKMWDSTTFACERTMLGGGGCFSVGAISAARLGSDGGIGGEVAYLYSGDDSGMLRAWDVEAGLSVSSRLGHELGIRALDASDGIVITGYDRYA